MRSTLPRRGTGGASKIVPLQPSPLSDGGSPPSLGEHDECARVRAIIFPHRTVGIAPQVHRTGLSKPTSRTALSDLVKRGGFANVNRAEIETQHGHPTLEQLRCRAFPI